jgi:hypothetical protein
MSLILTVNGRESIWMLADRRLSYRGRPAKEDGRKIMFLETTDGVAILGYAGLGATAKGTEPADWMSAVLRGRNFPLEQSLGELAGAMQRQFPRHLLRFPRDVPAGHNIVIPSFVNGEVRLYTIDLAFGHDRKTYAFRYTRHVVNRTTDRPHRTPRIGLAGSGAMCLTRDKHWIRELLRLVRACDSKRLSPLVVADQLAKINEFAHRNTADGTVGPRCIIAWRHNKLGVHKGGGGHQFYDGTKRTDDSGALPTIGNGMDIQALVQAMMPHMMAQMSALRAGGPATELDVTKVNADLAKLPDRPDENLK